MRWKAPQSVCVVTGASSGIGRALCNLLAADGATLVAVARRRERLDDLVSNHPSGSIIPVVGDITESSVRDEVVVESSKVRGGAVDLLVNNAGIGAIGPFADASPERLRRIMEVNFFAPVELTRSLLPSLRLGRASVICNIGSVLGHRAVPDKSEYSASKFAMHGFSDSLRCELAAEGIQVTLVSPSTTKSEFFDTLIDSDPNANSNSLGSWPPQRVAAAAFSAIRSRRSEVICSLGGKALVYADRICPPLMNRMLRK
jgi:short-subunit dehydrogenase